MHAVTLDRIRIDGGTQPRETIDQATVDEYAEAMERRTRFPPLVVYFDGENAWLADGFHRYYAAQKAGVQSMDVDWREGTLEMAKLYAAGANAEHGLRRTPGDKRRAIEMVLSTKAGGRWTQEQIAKHCHVSQSWVSDVVSKYRTDNAPKNAPPATKGVQKRAAIAVALQAAPEASDRRLAGELGVDRRTVGKVRARLTLPEPVASTSHEPASSLSAATRPDVPLVASNPEEPSASSERSRLYTSAATREIAMSILEAARVACAVWSDADWNLLLEQWADVVMRRGPIRTPARTVDRRARSARTPTQKRASISEARGCDEG
jgi:hypothetical protein